MKNKIKDPTIGATQKALINAPEGVCAEKAKKPTQIFASEGKHGVSESLADCAREGYQALFMPELALKRIEAERDSEVITYWNGTPSLIVTGRTKQDSKVVIYAHVPNFYSNPVNIRETVESGRLVNCAGPVPQGEFNRLEALNGSGRVFVIPYETLKQSSSGVINVDDAIGHPQTIPFLGLGREGAERYLIKHKEVYGNQIGIWHRDDFNKNTPLGRVLCLGNCYVGLDGFSSLDYFGQVFGIAPEPVAKNSNVRQTTVLQD